MTDPSFCLYLVGRLQGITRKRLVQAVEAAGGSLAVRPGRKTNVVAFGHSSALTILAEAPPLRLPAGTPIDAVLISERTLRRQLGLLPRSAEQHDLTLTDLQRTSGLDVETIRCLALYDVFEPSQDRFSFRDLRAAKEARRLLDAGYGLDEIAEASILLRKAERGLFDTSVTDAPWGELMQLVGGRLGRLDGQYELPLGEQCETADEIFAQAEEREQARDLENAERLYRLAARVDRSDPVIPFNLGNVLHALGRTSDATMAFQVAIARDPGFVEARINMAAVLEELGRAPDAEAILRQALDAAPNSEAALYNLGLLLTRDGRYPQAHRVWARYLSLVPEPRDTQIATYLKSLSRLELSVIEDSDFSLTQLSSRSGDLASEELHLPL